MEKMISLSVNKTGFEDRIVQFGFSDDFLALPFCGVIVGARVGADVQITDQHEFFDTTTLRRADSRTRALHMYLLKSLNTIFTACARARSHRITSGKGAS